jgi:plastocyanin
MAPGAVFVLPPLTPGTYNYYCMIHGYVQMNGVIVVT